MKSIKAIHMIINQVCTLIIVWHWVQGQVMKVSKKEMRIKLLVTVKLQYFYPKLCDSSQKAERASKN